MRQRLYAGWMRLRGYRRVTITTSVGQLRGWYRDTPYDPRFHNKTGEGTTDDGRHISISFYGVVPPQEGKG